MAIVSESFSTTAAYEHSDVVVMYSTHLPEVRSSKPPDRANVGERVGERVGFRVGAVGGWVGDTVGASVGANVPT